MGESFPLKKGITGGGPMHIGPYSTEPETMAKIEDFIGSNGLQNRMGRGGKHHEIYLSNPRRTKPEKLKTVFRHPVEKV